MLIGTDNQIHKPDTINFSHLLTAKKITRTLAASLSTILKVCSPLVEEVSLPSSIGVDTRRVTRLQETEVNEKIGHMACLHKTYSKECWAQKQSLRRNVPCKLSSMVQALLHQPTLVSSATSHLILKSPCNFSSLPTTS